MSAIQKDTHSLPMNLSGDVVRKALTRQTDLGEITEAQSDTIWWFFSHCKEHGTSFPAAAELIGYKADTTLRRLFVGDYGAKVDNVVAKIQDYRSVYEERSTYKDVLFVETRTAQRIWQACDAALISQTVVFLVGDSQIGKTAALQEYQRRNNHGKTRYVRVSSSTSFTHLVKTVAKACLVSTRRNLDSMREKIMDSLTDRNLLIVDEVHMIFETVPDRNRVKMMEFLREIHDATGCGLVLCGTHTMKREIEEGIHAKALEQLRRRGTVELNLPPRPTWKDVETIAAQFGLEKPGDAARDVVRDVIYSSGLGKLIKHLQNGHRMAAKAGETMTWKHFIEAYTILKRFATLDKDRKELEACV